MKDIILVTGGAGFIGSHLSKKLLDEGYKVVILDSRSVDSSPNIASIKDHKKLTYVEGDVRDIDQINDLVNEHTLCIFHFAAIVGIKNYLEDPLKVIDVNVVGTKNIFSVAAKYQTRTIFSSTSEIFGKNPNIPWSEDGDRVLGPTSIERWSYSSSKAIGEHMAYALYKTNQLPITIVRYFNVYGPYQNPIFIISNNINRVLNNLPPVVYDSGLQTRCFTYIKDAIDATMKIFKNPVSIGTSYNIGSTKESTISEVIEAVLELSEKPLIPEYVDTAKLYGNKYQDIERRIPNVEKIKKEIGWESTTNLREGIAQTLKWAQQNPWWSNGSKLVQSLS